jgi:hypothetical protein
MRGWYGAKWYGAILKAEEEWREDWRMEPGREVRVGEGWPGYMDLAHSRINESSLPRRGADEKGRRTVRTQNDDSYSDSAWRLSFALASIARTVPVSPKTSCLQLRCPLGFLSLLGESAVQQSAGVNHVSASPQTGVRICCRPGCVTN